MTTPAARQPAAAPPTCPRHPDRVTYVRCQRCGRPACPDCAVPATVGVHCVDCVREAQKSAPTQRSALGAPGVGARPVVTYTMMALCILSYVLQMTLGSGEWISRWAFTPFLATDEPWRFLTAAFVHSNNVLHLAMNMYALFFVGPYLERMLGRWRFTALYLLSAVGGHVAILLLADPSTVDWIRGTVGASGAVFGLFAAVLLVTRRLGRQTQPMLIVIGINLVYGFLFANVSWQGHVGGLVTGAVLGAAYAYAPKERRTVVGVGATVAVAGVLVVLTMLGSTQG